MSIIWKFNGLKYHHYFQSIAILQSYVILFNLILLFWGTGRNVSADWPPSTTLKGGGLTLNIMDVRAEHAGQYVCWVKETNMEILRSYNIIVDGEELIFCSMYLAHCTCIFHISFLGFKVTYWIAESHSQVVKHQRYCMLRDIAALGL